MGFSRVEVSFMGWSAWIPMSAPSGGIVGRPASVARSDGITNIYVRGTDNALWQRAYFGVQWHGWGRHGDGMQLTSSPAVASMGIDHEHVFVRGADGHLHHKFWKAASGWSPYFDLGAPPGGFKGSPATVSRNSQVANVYVRGNDDALWQLPWFNSTWHPWARHNDGMVLASDPTAGSMGPNHEHVFVRGTDGNVHHKFWQAGPGWSGYFNLGAPSGGFRGGPSTISRNPQVANVYVRGNDDGLWQLAWYDNSWHPWGRHADGAITAEVALASTSAQREQVFARGLDANVWQRWWVPRIPTIDVNLISVGRDNFTAANIEQMLNSLTATRQIYCQADFNVGTVRRYVISAADAGALEIIDSAAEAEQLTDGWTVPNAALDVFVVRSMNGADGWSAVGGPCDKNAGGSVMTGTVVSLNGDHGNSGNTFAHEIGHYLGLDHIADADNFIGNNGSSNSNTRILAWQGDLMKKHCMVVHI
jgi:hypothetical protein